MYAVHRGIGHVTCMTIGLRFAPTTANTVCRSVFTFRQVVSLHFLCLYLSFFLLSAFVLRVLCHCISRNASLICRRNISRKNQLLSQYHYCVYLCLNMNGMKKEKGTSDSYERYVESEVWTKGEYIQSAYYRRKGPACSRLGIRSQDICRFS